MTAATLHIATPTVTERTLLRVADGLTAYVAHRRERRIERRELALDLLREQQSRKRDPRAVDYALAMQGVNRR
ncbi:MAG: hypothetical protein LBU78_13335 [Microbacterium sp.]|jgi:response regulator RpfG family c-di-GMP phosphodiesterase|nr:hypothetical protein [Microbacterium sp.]